MANITVPVDWVLLVTFNDLNGPVASSNLFSSKALNLDKPFILLPGILVSLNTILVVFIWLLTSEGTRFGLPVIWIQFRK